MQLSKIQIVENGDTIYSFNGRHKAFQDFIFPYFSQLKEEDIIEIAEYNSTYIVNQVVKVLSIPGGHSFAMDITIYVTEEK